MNKFHLCQNQEWVSITLPDQDSLNTIKPCKQGQVPKYTANSWSCADDIDTDSDTDTTIPNTDKLTELDCSTGQIIRWNGTDWACGNDVDTTIANTDLLASLSCEDEQVPKWIDNKWQCGLPFSSLNFSCTNGYQYGKWSSAFQKKKYWNWQSAAFVLHCEINGYLDVTFNSTGKNVSTAPLYMQIKDIVVDSTGKVLTVGNNNTGNIMITRFASDGSLDTSLEGGNGYIEKNYGASSHTS